MWIEASKSMRNRRLLLSMGAIALILLTLWISTGRYGGASTVYAQISSGITSPAAGSVARGEVPILGTATIGGFQRYELYYKPALAADDTYTFFDEGVNVVINGQLGIWDTTNLAPGDYTLRLRVVQNDGNYAEFFAQNISVNPPAMPTPAITPFAGATDPAGVAGLITPTADTGSAQISLGRPITGTVARTITLLGRGAASAAPNYVRVRLFIAGAVADPNTVGFRFASEADLQQVVLTLQSAGVPLEELRSIPFSRRSDASAGVGEIRFLYRQPGNLSAFLSDALNRLAGNPNTRVVDIAVQFGVDNCAPLEVEAMRAAILSARARAEPMAQVLNVSLGPVLSVSENVPSIPVTGSCLNLADQTEFMPLVGDTPTEVEVAVTLAVTFVMVEAPAGAIVEPTPTPFLEPTPTPDPSQFPAPTPATTTFHTIQLGETLDTIAVQYGVTVESILVTNNLTPETAQLLQPGQTLSIPQQ
jgi:uncharacterized protein YggE